MLLCGPFPVVNTALSTRIFRVLHRNFLKEIPAVHEGLAGRSYLH